MAPSLGSAMASSPDDLPRPPASGLGAKVAGSPPTAQGLGGSVARWPGLFPSRPHPRPPAQGLGARVAGVVVLVAVVASLAAVSETVRVWLVGVGFDSATAAALVFLLVSVGSPLGVALVMGWLGERGAPEWLLAALLNGGLLWLVYSLVVAAS